MRGTVFSTLHIPATALPYNTHFLSATMAHSQPPTLSRLPSHHTLSRTTSFSLLTPAERSSMRHSDYFSQPESPQLQQFNKTAALWLYVSPIIILVSKCNQLFLCSVFRLLMTSAFLAMLQYSALAPETELFIGLACSELKSQSASAPVGLLARIGSIFAPGELFPAGCLATSCLTNCIHFE